MHFWLQSNEHNRNYVCFCQSDSGFEGKRGMYLSVSGKWVQYYVENAFHSYVNIFLDLLQLLLILLFLCLVRFLVWSLVSSATSLSCLLTLSRVRKSFIFSLKLGYSIITTRMCIPFYWICDSSYTSRDSHLQIPMDQLDWIKRRSYSVRPDVSPGIFAFHHLVAFSQEDDWCREFVSCAKTFCLYVTVHQYNYE